MKRLNSHYSFDELTLICSPKEKVPKRMQCFSQEFQAMMESLEEEDFLETGFRGEKKRRLNFDQVKALEMNFELDNKLEPGRKMKLAAELDLQPRQVAIWFQNRRARWKTKQLERDYSLLKANYDALKIDINSLEQEKQNLAEQLMKLKSKLKEEGEEEGSVKSSQQHWLMASSTPSPQPAVSFSFNTSSSESSMQFLNSFDSRMILENMSNSEYVTVEEQSTLFSMEDSCNIFSIDQVPTLQW